MSETGILLEQPQGRLHPTLISTELRPLDEVFRESEADNRGIADIYETDEDFRGRVDSFNAAYSELAEAGEITDEQLYGLIDGVYADDAVQRRATHLATRPRNGDPTIGIDIDFCSYLDFALPIDPADRVTPNQAQDGKLYWIDYILRQGEKAARPLSFVEVEAVEPSEAETPQVPRSVALRQELTDYEERTRNAKWWDAAKLAGGTALVATSETVLPHATTTPGVIAGIALGGWGALRATGRLLNRSGLKDAARQQRHGNSLQQSCQLTICHMVKSLPRKALSLSTVRQNLKMNRQKVMSGTSSGEKWHFIEWLKTTSPLVNLAVWSKDYPG